MTKYTITLTDDASPGKVFVPLRIPGGPALQFRRRLPNGEGDERLVLDAELTEEQVLAIPGGFDVRRATRGELAEMKKDELEALAAERGVEVDGTGADGAVTKNDLVQALSG